MATKKEKPLTLQGLVKYNQEVLFPFLDEHFAMKKDLDKFTLKNDFNDFKDKSLSNQDKILGKLDTLLQEKKIGDAQDKRQKEVLKIHNNALKKNKILTEQEVVEINNLRVF